MASKIKVDNVLRLLNAANDTINDLLKENFELKQQMNLLLNGKYEHRNIERNISYSE